MRRGDVYLMDFEPVLGGEADKSRPAVVVSNDAANRSVLRTGRGVLAVVPVTSNVSKVFPFQVRLPAEACGLSRDSKAPAEQLRSVTVERVLHRIGAVPVQLMRELDGAMRRHLAL